MRNDIISVLKENANISAYKVNTTTTESYELFFVHNTLETVRSTSTTDTTVTVYVEHDEKLGDATFSVYASTTLDELKEKTEKAVNKALLVNNKPYSLPECEELVASIPSTLQKDSPKDVAAKIAKAVFAANDDERGSINALEVFMNKITTSVVNSNGLNKQESKYVAAVEAIPTWNEGESVELYKYFKFSELDENAITNEIKEAMREVSQRGIAQKPNVPINCNMVLCAQELSELFANITDELGYASVYFGQNAFSKGDSIAKDQTGDAITVSMKASIPGSADSAVFDADGVTLSDVCLIKDGVVTNYYGSNRYAQYLGENVTGVLKCISVETGTLTEDEMKLAPYIECVSMSGLQVDVYNDYIGGEVRLGYYFDGEKITPVTGISVSGKLSTALSTARLLREASVKGNYYGPQKGMFGGITVI
ncbi:MAG: hypothetical protein E7312_03810 [Clostridiales bacterium]|nr:hypothetical protein [Clostridiales bacterium]